MESSDFGMASGGEALVFMEYVAEFGEQFVDLYHEFRVIASVKEVSKSITVRAAFQEDFPNLAYI
ncbi:MAG: hypothetical protein H7Y37_03925 [Anaerolineae bacterium]|nr:hypothetical protein [Gloeobacterales cyanobacterium ES-bin-313]